MKFIHAGYTKFLNMFKTFVLTCQFYTNEKNTIQMNRDGLEWVGMTPWINSNSPFLLIREQIRHNGTGALTRNDPYCQLIDRSLFAAGMVRNSKNPVIFIFIWSAYNNWWHSVTYIWFYFKWEIMIILLNGFKLIKLMRFHVWTIFRIQYHYP